MASFGTGSASHLAGELFNMRAGINLVHVPYRGGAPMVTDLIAGQVQAFRRGTSSGSVKVAGSARKTANLLLSLMHAQPIYQEIV